MEEYLKKIKADKDKVRDPIYGFIPLTKYERKLIDTPLFQRMRRVHQLALTKYVYPSAEHSRFVHSLGVMHCATLMLAGIYSHKASNIDSDPNENRIKTLRYAALLHDIGHLPFSHAVEKQWLKGASHEQVSIFAIERYKPIADILAADDIDITTVASLLQKKTKEKHRLLHEIISGQLDADRADYLLRDSHCCGVRYGEYDFHRFLQIFAAKEDEEHASLTLCVDEKDLHVAESLLIARYHYNLQIPYHRTRSGYDYALRRFAREHTDYSDVFTIEDAKISGVDFERLELLDDGTIFEKIKEKYRNGDPWAAYLLRQKHLCPLIDTNSFCVDEVEIYKAFVKELQGSSGFEEEEDYFVQNQKVEMLKGGKPSDEDIPIERPSDSKDVITDGAIRLLVSDTRKGGKIPVDIRRRSWIFGQLDQEPHRICRVYVTPEKLAKCKDILVDLPVKK